MAVHPKDIKKIVKYKLKRTLSLFEVTASGIGLILGAGIYALLGIASGYAGNSLWLSFLLAAVIAAFTGLSYAELSSIFKGDSTEYEYTKKAFSKTIAWVIGMSIIFAGILSGATVAIGFSNYLNALTGLPMILFAIILVAFLSLINFAGIKLSTTVTIVATFLEVFGLLAIIILGIKYWGTVNLLEFNNGLKGVLQATALVFFAYMGFESIVKLTEETKHPKKNIPKALLISIIVTSVIYILTAISSISIMGYERLSLSNAPLAETASVPLGQVAFMVLAVIALFSTMNTVLLSLVTTSRITYGLAAENALPRKLSLIHPKTNTPGISILVIGIITVVFIFLENIETVANAANIAIFLTFSFVNASLLVLRYKIPQQTMGFRAPFNIGKFSITSLLGLIFSIILLIYSIINIISV